MGRAHVVLADPHRAMRTDGCVASARLAVPADDGHVAQPIRTQLVAARASPSSGIGPAHAGNPHAASNREVIQPLRALMSWVSCGRGGKMRTR